MNSTTKSYGIAFGLPLDEAITLLETSAKELTAASAKVTGRSTTHGGFGKQISASIKRKLGATRYPRANE
jgi:hypothetical protein